MSVVQICGAGESYAASEKLSTDENRIAEELKKHQVTQHGHSPILTAKTPATKSHSNLEEQIRRRAHEIYEERGREDGHDMEDWLRAEAEITGTGVKAAAA